MDRLESMRGNLQKVMLRNGARLASLDNAQKWLRTRNNNIEGKAYPSQQLGEIAMNQLNQNVVTENPNQEPSVAPAGGKTDSEIAEAFMSALRRPGSTVHVDVGKSYTQQALEVAIPTVIVAAGIVGTVAVLTVIDSKWGMGARQTKLIESGALGVKALGNGGLSMDLPAAQEA